MRAVSRPLWLVVFVVVLLVGSFLTSFNPQAQLAPPPELLDAVWVCGSGDLLKLSAADGTTLVTQPVAAGAVEVAVDEISLRSWAFAGDTLFSFNFTGTQQTSTMVSGIGGGNTVVRLAAHGGVVWLASDDQLLRFDSAGQLLGTIQLAAPLTDLAIDRAVGDLRVATATQVFTFDPGGAQTGVLDLGAGANIVSIDVDRTTRELWAATSSGLQRFDLQGTLTLTHAVSGIERLASDGNRGVWASTSRDLLRVDGQGVRTVNLPRFSPQGSLQTLAAAGRDGSAWVGTQQTLSRVDGTGQVVLSLSLNAGELTGRTSDVALYEDLIPPAIQFTSPTPAQVFDTVAPTFDLTYSDIGQGLDPSTLQVTLGGSPVAVECTAGPLSASCAPAAAIFDGDYTLSASLADLAGNVGIAQVGFRIQLPPFNRPPVLAPVGDQSVDLGDRLTVDLAAVDPDGDSVSFAVAPLPLPTGGSFNAASGHFEYAPAAGSVGSFDLTFSATDGEAASSETVTVTVVGPAPGTPTGMAGRVLDTTDFLVGIETPVVGALVTVKGSGVTAVTASDGSFVLSGVPGGDQVFQIDASGAALAPDGSPYASFREEIELIDGVVNQVTRPFFLPRIAAESLTTVDPNATTMVVNATLGGTLEVPPQTAMNEDGTNFTGQLSISEVPGGLAPAALPDELDPGMLITIQPVGVNFAQPVPLTLPNTDGLPPGSEMDLWSLDPDSGAFKIVGVGRVSADGSMIETISGGVNSATWHAFLPPFLDFLDFLKDLLDKLLCSDCNTGSDTSLAAGHLTVSHDLPRYQSLDEDRGVSLIYASETADPRPVLFTDVTVPVRAAVPNTLSAELTVGGSVQGSEIFTATTGLSENQDETVRQAVQLDGRNLPTGAYPYQLMLRSNYSTSRIGSTQAGRTLIHNRRSSPVGAGWGIGGLERLHLQSDGTAVLARGDGSLGLFRPLASSIDFPDFSDLSRFQLNGTVAALGNPVTSGSRQVLRLTNAGSQTSTAFLLDAVPLREQAVALSWSTTFQVQITNSGGLGGGADGLTLTLSTSPTVIGGTGGFLAYSGINPSVAIELDTFTNSWDPNNNHVGINLNGNITSQVTQTLPTNLKNGLVKNVWVDYDAPTNRLEVRVSESSSRPALPLVSLVVDIPALLGDSAFFGFTAATASGFGTHDILSWQLSSSAGPTTLGAFVSPDGDFSTLVGNPDGTFTRSLVDSSRVEYDATGLQTSVVDTNGNTTSMSYDASERLTAITDPVGATTSLTYGGGFLSSITDPAGRVTTLTHDAAGDLTSIQDADGSSRSFTYDGEHRMTSQTSKRGFVTTYEYDFAGRNVRSVRPDGTDRRVLPANRGGLVDPASGLGTSSNPAPPVRPTDSDAVFFDGNGNATSFQTDGFGAATRSVDALGRVSTVQRDANGNPVRIVNPGGTVTELVWDVLGNLTTVREAVGTPFQRQASFTYEPTFHRLSSVTDAGGNTASITLDAAGNPMTVLDPLGGQSTLTYDPRGLVLTSSDPLGRTTSFTYDARGNLATVTDPNGVVTAFTRDAAGNVLTMTEAQGRPEERTRSFTYDPLNRLTSATDPLGAVSTFIHDAEGNVVQAVAPTGEITQRQLDSMGRLAVLDHPATGAVTYTYDGNGNPLTVTDALGRSRSFTYDAADRTLTETDPVGGIQRFTYDAEDNLLSFENPRGQITQFTYDALKRVTRRTDPLGRAEVLTWDALDRLVSATDAKGQTVTHTYDALSRLLSTTLPGDQLTFTYDAVGNLLTAQDGDSSQTYAYDALDQLTTVMTADLGFEPALTMSFTYDAFGNRIQRSDTAGGTVDYAYDAANRLVSLATNGGAGSSFSWDASNRLTSVTLPNGITADSTYGSRGLLTDLVYRDSLGAVLTSFSYGHDAVGQIVSVTEGTMLNSLSYDTLQRLVAGGPAGRPETYSYDAAGNRLTSHLSTTHVYDVADQLLEDDAFRYTYDANGNLATKEDKTSGAVTSYSWDGLDRLVSIAFPDGTSASYRYDAFGRRLEKNVDGQITRFAHDGNDTALAYDGTGVVTSRFAHRGLDLPVSVETGGQEAYYLTDHEGSVRFLTDSTGAAVNRYEYDSFGNTVFSQETLANPFTFTGRELDAESGLYFYRNRYYDPGVGRFIGQDPIGLVGGANLFTYVGNDPVNRIDPLGLFDPLTLIDAASFAASAAAFANCPSLGNAFWLGFDALALLTPLPSRGGLRFLDDILGGLGKGLSRLGRGLKNLFRGGRGLNNPIPRRLARVVDARFAHSAHLGGPGAADVFVTAADDIAGLTNSSGLANRLTLLDNAGNVRQGPFAVIEFDTPASGLASPVFRSNPGFVQGGLTRGGAREFVLPNLPVGGLGGVTIRIVP